MADIDETVLRLEGIACNDEYANRGEALLRLAVYHLRNPGVDRASASWTAARIEDAIRAFESGDAESAEEAFHLDRGKRHSAQRWHGRDQQTGLRWPVRILIEVTDLQRHYGFKTGSNRRMDSVFAVAARNLNRIRGRKHVHWTEGEVRDVYYKAQKDKQIGAEYDEFMRRVSSRYSGARVVPQKYRGKTR